MANKEVKIGDDWYLGENNNGDLIFYNSRKDEVVKAIDVITGAEDKKSKKLENIGQLGVSSFISGNKEEGYSINNVLPPLTRNDNGAFLSQAGDPSWNNRTYEGYEKMEEGYNIGSSEDFSTFTEAANKLNDIIVSGKIKLTLQEDQTFSNVAEFANIITASTDPFIIDLGGHTLSYDGTDNYALRFQGPFCTVIRNGTLKMTSTDVLRGIGVANLNTIRLNGFTIDINGQTMDSAVCVFDFGTIHSQNMTYSNDTNLSEGDIYLFRSGFGQSEGDSPSLSVKNGARYIKNNGDIVTEGGIISPA